jgi:endoglucanase
MSTGYLAADGPAIVTALGREISLRGVCLGGWMNLENHLMGFPGTEQVVRKALRRVLGPEAYELFFDRYLSAFYADEDAAFLASLGFNSVRIAINYRHFEDDQQPFVLRAGGFRQLDRAIAAGAAHGLYSIIDLHAAQGYQNHQWHSDNTAVVPLLWDHPHFQDRVVWLWGQLAAHYRDEPWVAGYNLINEPADPDGNRIGPLHRRIIQAIRQVDPHHLIFLDGNTYGSEFESLGDPIAGVVYDLHHYPIVGRAGNGTYPGVVGGVHWDREEVRREFQERSSYMRRHRVPAWVGEFGVTYEDDPVLNASRTRLLRDQLDIYNEARAGWAYWTYKDIGVRALVYAAQTSPWIERIRPVLSKKWRLAVDQSGVPARNADEYMAPLETLLSREFPFANPYPFGLLPLARDIVRSKLVAEQLVEEFALLFDGLREDDLTLLADSFRLSHCTRRQELIGTLSAAAASLRPSR